MSGIGGVVNAEFKVDAAKAAADLQRLVHKFSEVEKAVNAASKGLDVTGASMGAVEAAHKELYRQLERSTGAVKVSDKEWVKYAATLYTIHNVASLVGRSIERVYDAAAEGAKIQAAQQFFENAGKSIESYRTATNGMISDAELMKKANLADSMGIDEATFKKLVVVAEASALKTGQSFDHMFNSIIVGTARSSRLLLDNLGIIVSVDQANQNYARSVLEVGKNHVATQQEINAFISSMDAEAKQLAFVQEVAKQSQGTIDEYGQLVDKTAQNFAQLEAATQNAADAIKIALTNSFSSAVGPLTQLATTIAELASELGRMNATPIVAGGLLAGLLGFAAAGPMGALIGGFTGTAMGLGASMDAQDAADALESEKGKELALQLRLMREYSDALGQQGDVLQVALSTGTQQALEMAREASFGSDELYKAFTAAQARFSELNDQLGRPFKPKPETKAPGTTTPPKTADASGRGQKEEKDTLDKTLSDYNNAVTEQEKVILKHMETVFEQSRKMLNPAFSGGDVRMAGSTKHDGSVRAEIDFAQKMRDAFVQPLKDAFESVQAPLADALRGLVSTVIQGASGIADALMGQGGLMTAIGQLAGGILEGVGGLMQTLVSVAGDALAPITFGISAIVAKPLNAMISVFTEGGAAALSAFGKFGDTMAPIIELMTYVGDVLYGVKNALGDSFDEAAAAMRDGVTLLGRTLIFLADTGVIKAVADMFAQLFTSVVNIFTGFSLLREGLSLLFNMFTSLGTIFDLAIGALKFFGDFLMGLNDFIVVMMRDAFGQTGWGKLSSELRVEFDPAPMEDNTEAVRENTAALRDFAREFRNLPANFKANGYIFDSQAGLRLHDPLGSASFAPGLGGNNQRTRT